MGRLRRGTEPSAASLAACAYIIWSCESALRTSAAGSGSSRSTRARTASIPIRACSRSRSSSLAIRRADEVEDADDALGDQVLDADRAHLLLHLPQHLLLLGGQLGPASVQAVFPPSARRLGDDRGAGVACSPSPPRCRDRSPRSASLGERGAGALGAVGSGEARVEAERGAHGSVQLEQTRRAPRASRLSAPVSQVDHPCRRSRGGSRARGSPRSRAPGSRRRQHALVVVERALGDAGEQQPGERGATPRRRSGRRRSAPRRCRRCGAAARSTRAGSTRRTDPSRSSSRRRSPRSSPSRRTGRGCRSAESCG